MRPRVIVHNTTSIDGKLDWLTPSVPLYDDVLGLHYRKAACFGEDATLVGAGTALKALEWSDAPLDDNGASGNETSGDDTRPLLVIPDSRGRIRNWSWWLSLPFWRAGVALCSRSTPPSHLSYLESARVSSIVTGNDEVDLASALEELYSRFGVRTIRTDSGGTLNGQLLVAGLVDEVSILIVPVVAGAESTVPLFSVPRGEQQPYYSLRLVSSERLENGLLWLRYEVTVSGLPLTGQGPVR